MLEDAHFQAPAPALYDYDAFLSYRRRDGELFARWLRTKLLRYRLPPVLARGRKPLRVYFDRSYERANEDFWKHNIENALRRSRYLIVIITPLVFQPRSDGSQNWVEREIEFFSSLPQGRNILVANSSRKTDGQLPRGLRERFPNICVTDFRAAGRLIAHESALTLLASLYEIPDTEMPLFRQEEKHRKQRAIRMVSSAVLVTVIILVGIALFIRHTFKVQEDNAAYFRHMAEADARRRFLLQLRLAVANLNSEARARSLAQERRDPAPPFDLRLDDARVRVGEFLPAIARLSGESNGKWQELHDHIVTFLKTTKHTETFTIDGFAQFGIIDKDINELLNEIRD